MNKLTKSSLVIGFVISALVFAQAANARTCEVSITGDDKLQFNKSEIVVSNEFDKVKLTLEHVGKLPVKQMGHNWTLAKTADWMELAQLGQAAGLENDYLPVDDKRVITNTDMIGGGETTSITFDLSGLSATEEYTFFCSFPGHWAVMNGKFNIISDS